ncbi:MAG: universal stress protein [Herpetosiphonaceae bacterium]|nr:MAG: universal stress protein [Herpetosiphonaceae bacterium]
MERKILVPLDGSTLAEQVLPYAAALAQATDSGLKLLRVVEVIPMMHTLGWPIPIATIAAEQRQADLADAFQYLQNIARNLRAEGLEVDVQSCEGDPAAMILARASQDPDVTMIAMATHGRSGVSRWTFGSVAERVLRSAPVPLLLVRIRNDQDAEQPESDYTTVAESPDDSPFVDRSMAPSYESTSERKRL